ncbi:BF3164 family lipoprotein [Phocaeicola sp.]
MKTHSLPIVCVALLFASCSQGNKYKDAENFDFNTFKSEKSLTGKTLEFDSLIMRPGDIQVYDSLLVVIEPRSEKKVHLFNLNTHKKIGSRIMSGQGPKDMIQPKLMATDGKTILLFDMATFCIFRYDIRSFIANEDPEPMQRVKLEKPIFINAEQIGNQFIGYSYNVNHQLYAFDSTTGKKVNEMIDYPSSDIPYTDAEKLDAYYMNFVSNKKDRIAISYSMTDLIEFYDIDGNLQKRLHGPECFFAYFTEFRDEKVVTSSPDKERTRDAYFSPCNAGDRLFVLYDGGYVNDPNHDSTCERILSFSWDGVPDVVYTLDDPLLSFTVDYKQRKIYGVSDTPEYHLVEYSY